MDPSPTTAPQRRDPDSGRVAVPEIAELLHLQRPAAALAATAVVLLALLLTIVAPGLLPANVVTGAVVGVLAVLAGVAAAVVLDGRDPVLRGPRHLRRDGHAVLARMAGPDPVRHGAPVLAALGRRLDGKGHHSVLVTGTGASALAVALGRGAAADGHTALVIDLRSQVAPGVADVGAGTVRLGEAARLADDRPYAWIGAGVDREAAASAAAGVARRPPRDLELLLVVAPEAATHVPEVLQACERTILLVDADTQQRAMVTARMDALHRAGGRPEAVVVGGLRVVDGEHDGIDVIDGIDGIGSPAADEPQSAEDSAAAARPMTPGAPEIRPLTAERPAPEPEPATTEAPHEPEPGREGPVPFASFAPDAPAATASSTEPVVPPSPEPAPSPEPPPTIPEPLEPDEPEPTPTPEPGPDAPPVVVPDPEDRRDAAGADDRARGDREPGDRDAGRNEGRGDRGRSPSPSPALEDTGPIRPITFRTAGSDDTSVDGLADGDPLATTAALDHLLTRQQRNGA